MTPSELLVANGYFGERNSRKPMTGHGCAARRTASAAHATGLRGNLRNYASAPPGNEDRDTDIPRRLRIRARHSWNPSVTDVIVNT
jgi:hypothetical protein